MNFDILISEYPVIRIGVGNKVLCKWGLGREAYSKYGFLGFVPFEKHHLKRLIDEFPILCPNGRIVRRDNYVRLVPDGCKCVGTLLVYVYTLSRGYPSLTPDVANDNFTELLCEFLKLATFLYDVLKTEMDCERAFYTVERLIREMVSIVSSD